MTYKSVRLQFEGIIYHISVTKVSQALPSPPKLSLLDWAFGV